ncbi:uncharacterized protein LOC100900008 [Galendromus occidentalis]|uniref:Uncharacterized protein LOC100900008 n=1 Tax=Galendromus occidentalis TaxID=34638 RepID=A0AAJ6QMM3_9ACAR|nr:uncharacterized protein LOC100900008 [Galendromus occidentalis]
MVEFYFTILCLFGLRTVDYVSGQSDIVKSTLYNWAQIEPQLSEFEHWLCGNGEAIKSVTASLPNTSYELSETDVNGLICTYNLYSTKVTQVMMSYYEEIATDSRLAVPGYTMWDLFRAFADNRRDILNAFNGAIAGRSDADISWVFRNEETLADLKQAFLGAQKDLMGLQGYHF